jgi:cytochrome P450
MPRSNSHSLAVRLKRELPPTAPVPALLQTLACRRIPLGYFESCRARYGERFTVYPVDMPPVVFLSNPQDVHAVLTAPPTVLHPGAGVTVLTPLIGDSSFMLAEEDEHLSARRTIMPAFHRTAVQEHADLVFEIVQREVDSWPLDTAFPIHPRLRSLSLSVIIRTVFGEETPELQTLHGRLLDMLSVTTSFVLQEPRLRHLPGWRTTWKQFVQRRREVDESLFALIGRRRRGDARRGALLDMLLEAHNPDGSPMSDRQVRDQLISVILAGHETTASELAWAFQLLAHNPTMQDRLIENLDSDSDEEYLTATIQEVLRHRPVFLFAIPRVVVKPIEIGGWTYRPPAQLLGCIYLMHHDPAIYRNPDEFRPERFLGAPPQTRTWLPWGGGRKRCPGHHLAILEMRTVLRATLATRAIMPAGTHVEHAGWRSVIVTPHAGSQIILRKRRPGARLF